MYDYQLAFTTPGIIPLLASSLKQRRDNLNFFNTPLERPVNWQRLLRRTGEEFLGSLLRAIIAPRRSSSLLFKSFTTSFSCLRFSHFRLTKRSRFFCLATEDDFAICPIYPLFFARRTFLSLLTVWIHFVDYINASTSTYYFVPFRRVCFNRSLNFHIGSLRVNRKKLVNLIVLPGFLFKCYCADFTLDR